MRKNNIILVFLFIVMLIFFKKSSFAHSVLNPSKHRYVIPEKKYKQISISYKNNIRPIFKKNASTVTHMKRIIHFIIFFH